MIGVLVDTSVWVSHFRQRNDALTELLALDMVFMHPLILGELACGTLPARARTLADIERLQQVKQASVREVIDFVNSEELYCLGCGFVDMVLLVSTLMTPGIELWTQDKRLLVLVRRFMVVHPKQPRG